MSALWSAKRRRSPEDDDRPERLPPEASTSASPPPISERPKPKKVKRPAQTAGIIYISRVPPGMTPQKVRHLMARWGDVGKVYAQRRDAPTSYSPNARKSKSRHAAANFSEAWVEFADKSIAKTVARMLNAEVIGGKKGDRLDQPPIMNRWRDDIWTMKYLSGFKWEMLGERVAYERQAHQSRLRSEIARSKTEQGEYLRNVELARVLDKRKAKKAAAETNGAVGSGTAAKSKLKDGPGKDETGTKKGYRQRPGVEKVRGMEGKGMESVLGSVFG